jgi:hypothetical protein
VESIPGMGPEGKAVGGLGGLERYGLGWQGGRGATYGSGLASARAWELGWPP